ncbi:MAG: preprotein translocase subunit SecA, partial [Candidatus Dojkabacteria bacterium]|nr:preprotein translocase subunit SecA [Candidatus Dojkabacteria bacterium]
MFLKFKSLFDLNSIPIRQTNKPLQEIKKHINELSNKSFDEFRQEINKYRSSIKKLVEKLPPETFISLRKIERRDKLPPIEREIIAKLNEFMPRFYAMMYEVYKRKMGITYYDVQLRAGIILAKGQRLVELATGEGKTMTFQLPLFLYSLTGRGCHLVTVNDYLSKRDGEYAGHIASELGLTVGIITSDRAYKFYSDEEIRKIKGDEFWNDTKKDRSLSISGMNGINLVEVSKKEAYNCDIVYGTNNEFGFDYLRDNMVWNLQDIVQRELYFCIVDEVDSILIDEARTPLIISGMPSDSNLEKYITFSNAVKDLEENKHYIVDYKFRSVALTEEGILEVEKKLGINNLWKDFSAAYHIENALKAKVLFKKNQQYIVKNGEVLIVDEFTGRILPGRRYSDGLHQAIEAKEGVQIKQEYKTFATITFQNYFRLYKILCGGSGTIMTEAEEFYKIYGLESVPIPTNKPVIRKDYPDLVYKTEAAKFKAIVQDVKERHKKGQPVLIGTTSVEKSEIISEMLKQEGIEHEVLNAKYHEREAKIIEKAGRKGAVTVATNMAGRGADIVIGGGMRGDKLYYEVMELGGLHVIGSERHEARRIDNQLRGRTGRQGEPGSSRFYVSLDDQLMKILGGNIIARLMNFIGMQEDHPIENKLITKQIEIAQKRIESVNFDARKQIVEFDDVMNFHREIFYLKRRN